jgi:hypothetical protein
MKHALLLSVLAVVSYIVWQVLPFNERNLALRLLAHHGIRIGGLLLVLFALLAGAFYMSSTPIL